MYAYAIQYLVMQQKESKHERERAMRGRAHKSERAHKRESGTLRERVRKGEREHKSEEARERECESERTGECACARDSERERVGEMCAREREGVHVRARDQMIPIISGSLVARLREEI